MSRSTPAPRFFRRASLPATAAFITAIGAAGLATASVASASTLPVQTYTTGGESDTIVVPAQAISVHLLVVGGAGHRGGDAPFDAGSGGAGGHGTQVTEDVPIGPGQLVSPGSTLTLTVGALGGGGGGGDPTGVPGAPDGGAGGAGGGASTVLAPDGSALVIAAGGGGGGGGAGGVGGDGAPGGTSGAGGATASTGVTSGIAARGGSYGGACAAPPQVVGGATGETVEVPFNLGGGGGGGGQGCSGGGGGGSGDHGTGLANDGLGGGGGGAGGSFGAFNSQTTAGTNTGDGQISLTFTVLDAPTAPHMDDATAGDGQATVFFHQPDSDGGSPIDQYTITSSPDAAHPQGVTITTPGNAGSPATVTGLADGTTYTFTVAATNAAGLTGPASAASPAVTPVGHPSAPHIDGASAGYGATAQVFFHQPDSDGGSPIDHYTITSSPDAAHPYGVTVTTPGSAGSPATVGGLAGGTSYTFTVAATNAAGLTGPASAASPAVDAVGWPSAPHLDSVSAGNGRATVSFSPPDSDGGAPIAEYMITSSPDAASPSGATWTTTGSPFVFPNLTNGTSYTFSVIAINASGYAGPAAVSDPVTPAGPPAAPAGLTAAAGDGQVALTWTSPADDGGSPVTGYDVYVGTTAGGESATPVNASPLSAGSTGYTVDGLIDGSSYFFTIRALNAAGASPSSSESSATPVATPTTPSPFTPADLRVTIANLGRFVTGRDGRYGVQVTNSGDAATTGPVTVITTLPAGLSFVRASAPGWSCQSTGHTVTCAATAPLAPGAISSLQLLVHVTAPAGRTLASTATVAPSDATAADNTATNRVTVRRS